MKMMRSNSFCAMRIASSRSLPSLRCRCSINSRPPPLVLAVQLVAHALSGDRPSCAAVPEARGAWPIREGKQPAALEDAVELVETCAVPQFLQVEFFVRQRSLFAVVQADRAKIGDDSPGAARQGVEIIPALLHRGAAVGAVAVQVGHRALEFDHRQRQACARGNWPRAASAVPTSLT